MLPAVGKLEANGLCLSLAVKKVAAQSAAGNMEGILLSEH